MLYAVGPALPERGREVRQRAGAGDLRRRLPGVRPAHRPHRVVVGDDLAVRVDPGLDVPQSLRAVVVPAVVVPAHELKAHRRAAEQLRGDRCRSGGIVRLAVSESARALDVLDADLLLGHVQRVGHERPQAECALRVREHERARRADRGNAAARADRAVHLVVVLIGLRQHRRRSLECRVGVAGEGRGVHRLPGGVLGAELFHDVAVARQDRVVLVGDLQLGRRLDRVVLVRRDDGDEIAPANDLRAGQVLDRALVDREHLDTRAVGTLAARADETRVNHARQPDVLDVRVGARHLVGDVEPRRARRHELVVVRVLRRRDRRVQRLRAHRHVEHLAADQLPVRDGLAATRHDAARDGQARYRNAELRRRQPEQGLLRIRTGGTHSRAGLDDRRASDRDARVRRDVRVRRNERELAHVHVQLLADDHQEPRRRALAEVDAARVHRGRVVRVNREERVELVQVERARIETGVKR